MASRMGFLLGNEDTEFTVDCGRIVMTETSHNVAFLSKNLRKRLQLRHNAL